MIQTQDGTILNARGEPLVFKNTLYTVGYGIERWRPGAVTAELKRLYLAGASMDTIIDVRLHPFSQDLPDWNRERLSSRWRHQYIWSEELGNVNHQNRAAGIQLLDEKSGLQLIQAWLVFSDVLLLCQCADASKCHRSYVAKKLQERNACKVVHLLQDDLAKATARLSHREKQAERSGQLALFE